MRFWEEGAANPTLIVDEKLVDNIALNRLVRKQAEVINKINARTLGFICCDNRLSDVVLYISCLRYGHVPLLLPTSLSNEALQTLITCYRPNWVAGHANNPSLEILSETVVNLDPELGLLLSTSGSTGSPKLVRLSYNAIQANARSIVKYLQIQTHDRAITSLPLSYSYGLSVLNSHLLAGAEIILSNVSVLEPKFKEIMRVHQVTSLAGVPFVYQMLWRIGFFNEEWPTLKTLTQAGGGLSSLLKQRILEYVQSHGKQLYVMYGQTEATARISFVPFDHLPEKLDSIGVAIPEGELILDQRSGEIIYKGPNVMMGYAECSEDLVKGDVLNGILYTGDLGYRDEDGYFYVTGRIKRIVKLSGNRFNLDEIEASLHLKFSRNFAVSGCDDKLVVWFESASSENNAQLIKPYLAERFAIHPSRIVCMPISQLPLNNNGKVNYQLLSGQNNG